MTRRWREAFGVGDHRRLTCLSYGLELPSAEAYELAWVPRFVRALRKRLAPAASLLSYQFDDHGAVLRLELQAGDARKVLCLDGTDDGPFANVGAVADYVAAWLEDPCGHQVQAEREAVVARAYEFRPVPSKYAPPVSEKPVRRYDTSLYPSDPFILMLRRITVAP